MSDTDYKALTDDMLLEEYDTLARRVMYYAAAEGNWARETKDRNECERQYYAVCREIRERGIKLEH